MLKNYIILKRNSTFDKQGLFIYDKNKNFKNLGLKNYSYQMFKNIIKGNFPFIIIINQRTCHRVKWK